MPYMFGPSIFAGLRSITRFALWVSLGLTAPGNPKLEPKPNEKTSMHKPNRRTCCPCATPKSYPLLFLSSSGTDHQGSVQGTGAPGRASDANLEEHADGFQDGQSSVGKIG